MGTAHTISSVRVAFVLSERAEGLSPERMEKYRRVEQCLAGVARAEVTTTHYGELASVTADATVLSGSTDPWASHDPAALERLRHDLRAHSGPILGICAGMPPSIATVKSWLWRLLAAARGEEKRIDLPSGVKPRTTSGPGCQVSREGAPPVARIV